MLLLAYSLNQTTTALCDRDGCDGTAHYTAIALDGALVDHLCVRHAAQHMRGNAYALDPDPLFESREALTMNELDRFA